RADRRVIRRNAHRKEIQLLVHRGPRFCAKAPDAGVGHQPHDLVGPAARLEELPDRRLTRKEDVRETLVDDHRTGCAWGGGCAEPLPDRTSLTWCQRSAGQKVEP